MKTERSNRIFPSGWLRLLGLPALGFLSASAATVTWTGGGDDTHYDTATNWTPGAPADDDELVFPDGAGSLEVTLNGTFSPAKLHVTATGFNDYQITGTGGIAGAGVVIQKDGDAWLTLGGANHFSGEIRVNSGLLKLAPETGGISLAFGAHGNTVKIAPGAALDLNGQGSAAHAAANAAQRRFHTVELAGNGIEIEEGVFSGAITSGGNIVYGGYGKTGLQHLVLTADASVRAPSGVNFDLGLGPSGATAGTSGSITSSGATARTLTKTGAGTVFLGGAGTSGGSVTGYKLVVSEGTAGAASVTGLGDQVTVKSGAVLLTATTLNVTTPIELEDNAILSDYVGIATFSGPITLGGTPKFRATNTSNLTIASALAGPADVLVERTSGSGHVLFTADNVIAGTLYVTGAISAQLGTGGVTGSFKNNLGADSPVSLSNGTLVLNRSDSFTYDADITGTGTLQKNGAGTVRRTAPANFARPGGIVAAVNAGTLLVNNTTGDGLDGGNVTVSANATLGGTGSTAGPVVLGTAAVAATRAYLAPGDGPLSIGTFTTGGLQLAASGSGTLQFEVNGAAADKLLVNGDVLLGPAKIAEIAVSTFGGGATQSSYTLLEYTGALHGNFNSITGVPAGYRVRHDVSSKRLLLEQSAGPDILPQILYFDGGSTDIAANGDGAAAATAGNWNTTLLNWDQGPAAHLPWANDGSATAVLATGAYNMTVDAPAPLAVAGIKRFGATSSATLITGGTLALQPGADLLEARFGDSNQGLRIASKLTGTGGFNVYGGISSGANHSRVTLQNPAGDNTITGPVSILGGHLRLQSSHQLGDASVVTANTSIAGAVATLETGSGVNETIAGLHFGPNGGELKLGGTGVSELTLDGGGLTIANGATFTYGNSASGIRFANGGEFVKSGDGNVIVTRVNPANFIDLGGARTIRVDGFGLLSLGVNLVNGALVKQGEGTLVLTSDANAYQGNTTVAAGTLRLTQPTLHGGSTLQVNPGALLELGFATEETTNVVKTLIVAGGPLPAGRYGPADTTLEGVTGLDQITGFGIIEVDPSWGTATPFGLWAEQIADPGKRGETDDADDDGLDNFTEFAFDGNPSSGAAGGKVETKIFPLGGGNALVITFPVRSGAGAFTADANGLVSSATDGVIYRVQGSETLAAWTLPLTEVTGAPGIVPPAAALSSADWEYRSFRIDGPVSSRTKAFLRATAGE